MSQRLIVKCDRGGVGCNAERASDLYCGIPLRQLPQPAEQTLGCAPREHDAIAVGDPERSTCEDRQLALLLARGDDRQRVLAARARRSALLRERTQQAAWRGWRAQRRAELHQTLVEIAGLVVGG